MTLVRSAILGALLFAGFSAAPASAEETLATPSFKTPAAKPKPAKAASASTKERRPGELEGWESGVTAPVKPKPKRPADAIGERVVPDGGLPLPTERRGTPGQSPVGFDESGRMGGMFKF